MRYIDLRDRYADIASHSVDRTHYRKLPRQILNITDDDGHSVPVIKAYAGVPVNGDCRTPKALDSLGQHRCSHAS